RRSRKSPFARLMSEAVRMASVGVPVPPWPAHTGVVVGSRDRTVTPAEGDLPDADDRLVLPFAHNELMLRPNLAHATHRFLAHGTFDAPLALDLGDDTFR
ncbi:MAG: hypothetical protein KC613_03935, partial [Myxococcales bacterium]|nr:hypothetical protein [Myxococcales bacterium]